MSYDNPRIKSLNTTPMDIVIALAEGNPDALRVCVDLMQQSPELDPDSALGGLGPLFSLDNLDCYGPRIWTFYKDVCRQNYHTMIGLMRACQLGFTSNTKINAAISGNRDVLDIPDLLAQVKKRLPNFNIEKMKPATE